MEKGRGAVFSLIDTHSSRHVSHRHRCTRSTPSIFHHLLPPSPFRSWWSLSTVSRTSIVKSGASPCLCSCCRWEFDFHHREWGGVDKIYNWCAAYRWAWTFNVSGGLIFLNMVDECRINRSIKIYSSIHWGVFGFIPMPGSTPFTFSSSSPAWCYSSAVCHYYQLSNAVLLCCHFIRGLADRILSCMSG